MSDERLRELERRWKESGSDDDQTAWLVERVRVGERLDWDSYSRLAGLNADAASGFLRVQISRGDLTREELNWAASCSSRPAAFALDRTPEPLPTDLHGVTGLRRWLQELPLQVIGRAAVACARLALPVWEASYPDDARLGEAIEFARICVLSSSTRHAVASSTALQACQAAATTAAAAAARTSTHDPRRVELVASEAAANSAGEAVAVVTTQPGTHSAVEAGLQAVYALSAGPSTSTSAILVAQTIRAEVAQWSLGLGDPLQPPTA